MRVFETRELRDALSFADQGGQGLHLHRMIVNRASAPKVFKQAITKGERIAHLFDRDAARLEATARRLGVRVIRIERLGQQGQHIDLCGRPLERALQECDDLLSDAGSQA